MFPFDRKAPFSAENESDEVGLGAFLKWDGESVEVTMLLTAV